MTHREEVQEVSEVPETDWTTMMPAEGVQLLDLMDLGRIRDTEIQGKPPLSVAWETISNLGKRLYSDLEMEAQEKALNLEDPETLMVGIRGKARNSEAPARMIPRGKDPERAMVIPEMGPNTETREDPLNTEITKGSVLTVEVSEEDKVPETDSVLTVEVSEEDKAQETDSVPMAEGLEMDLDPMAEASEGKAPETASDPMTEASEDKDPETASVDLTMIREEAPNSIHREKDRGTEMTPKTLRAKAQESEEEAARARRIPKAAGEKARGAVVTAAVTTTTSTPARGEAAVCWGGKATVVDLLRRVIQILITTARPEEGEAPRGIDEPRPEAEAARGRDLWTIPWEESRVSSAVAEVAETVMTRLRPCLEVSVEMERLFVERMAWAQIKR